MTESENPWITTEQQITAHFKSNNIQYQLAQSRGEDSRVCMDIELQTNSEMIDMFMLKRKTTHSCKVSFLVFKTYLKEGQCGAGNALCRTSETATKEPAH